MTQSPATPVPRRHAMPGAARRREVLHFWGNLLGYQAVWFIAVIGAGHGWAWPGPISALSLIHI